MLVVVVVLEPARCGTWQNLGGLASGNYNYNVPIGGGGGGWGYGAVNINSTTINYTVGSGGIGSSNGNGATNGGNSNCLTIIGYGGVGARDNSVQSFGNGNYIYLLAPGGQFSAPNGQNGQSGLGTDWSALNRYRVRGGGAGGTSSTVCVGSDVGGAYKSNVDVIGVLNSNRDIDNVESIFYTCSPGYTDGGGRGGGDFPVVAVGGGNGNDGTGTTVTGGLGSISPINQTYVDYDEERDPKTGGRAIRATAIGGNGIYGGGGSPSNGGNWNEQGDSISYNQITVSTYVQGNGGTGVVYVSWIDLTVSKTTLRSSEPITVSWSSPVDSGSQTVSYTNNGTTNITETYTKTDSRGAQSTITFTILPAVRITSFTANPNPQTSGIDGVPNYDTQLSWSAIGATSASINQSIGNVSGSGSTTVTNLPQSTAGSNSPASRTYTLTASDGFSTDTATVTVSVYNDNTPNNFSLPNQNNVNPNTSVTVSSTISGIDMVTSVNGGPGVQVSTNGSSFSSNTTITNNQTVYARVTSLGFNQSPNGLTNSREFYVDVGTLRRFFTVTTKAPDVNELFNFPDQSDKVPYPDIDTINEPSEPYIVSNELDIDDIELINPSGVEIRTNNGNIQVRIKRQGASSVSGWTNVRQI